MDTTAWLYLPGGWADWEPGFLTAELNTGRWFRDHGTRMPVRTVAASRDPVVSMGGMRSVPDAAVDEVSPEGAGLLILPGADTWLTEDHTPILNLTSQFIAAGVPVAAICGATLALAEAGFLDERAHTSDDLSLFQHLCPGYHGAARYVEARATTGAGVTTAGGVSPVHFAAEVFRVLDVMRPGTVDAWFQLNSTAEARYFGALQASVAPAAPG